MSFCSSKRCVLKNVDQAVEQFLTYNNLPAKTCLTCRQRGRNYSHRNYYGLSTAKRGYMGGVTAQVNMRASKALGTGSLPKFNFEWERGRYKDWLQCLAQEVIHD